LKADLHYIANTNSSGFSSIGTINLEGADIHLDTEDVDSESGEGFVEVSVLNKVTANYTDADEENLERSIILNAKNFIMLDRTVSEEERAEMKAVREKAEQEAEDRAKNSPSFGSGIIPGRIGRGA
jgi:hypothetical protein